MTRLPARATALVGALMLLAACSGTPEPSAADQRRDVGVQLFQWTWDAIAAECTDTLGPDGYAWVLTSPPQEHIVGEQWWTVLPAGELPGGVAAGHARAVRGDGADVPRRGRRRVGRRGDQPHDRPGRARHRLGGLVVHALRVPRDLDGRRLPPLRADPERRHRQLPGRGPGADLRAGNLADLATETEHVRSTITAYLEDLLSLGVDGFRIDAAKHMPPEDIAAIVAGLPEGTGIAQEVIRGSGEPITPEQYLGNGQVYEFAYGKELQGVLAGSPGLALDLGTSSTLGAVRPGGGVRRQPRHRAQRLDAQLRRRRRSTRWRTCSCSRARTARPVVYSGYAFSDRDAGPPQDGDGRCSTPRAATDPQDGDWVCQHRWPQIAGMVGWRNVVGDAPGSTSGRRATPSRSAAASAGSSWSTPATTSCAPTWRRACPTATTATCCRPDDCAASTVRDGTITVTVPPRTAQAWDVSSRP